MYGKAVELPDSLLRKKPIYNYDNYADQIKREFIDAWQLAKQSIDKKKQQRKTTYDTRANDIIVNVGDKILIKKQTKDRKFDMAWSGPYVVTDVPSNNYVLYSDGRNKQRKINKDNIKLAKANYFLRKMNINTDHMINLVHNIRVKHSAN